MSIEPNDTVTRVRTDLETLGLAAGFGPRYGPEDVGAFTGYGLAGLLLAAWGMTPLGRRFPGPGMGLFFVAGVAVWAFYARRNLRRRVHPAARLREARLGIAFTLLFCATLLGSLAWAHWQGLSRAVATGAGFALGGLLAAVLGLTDRWRRLWLGFAGPMVVLGALWPTLPEPWWNAAFGAAYAIGCWAAAGILRGQLRELSPAAATLAHAH